MGERDFNVKSWVAGMPRITVPTAEKLGMKLGKTVSKRELKMVRGTLKNDDDKFTSDTARRAWELTAGRYAVRGGKVKEIRTAFMKGWKLEKESYYRERWGVTDISSPKAPMFQGAVPYSRAPAAMRERFEKQAWARRREDTWQPGDGPMAKARLATSASAVYGRDGSQVGWILEASFYERSSNGAEEKYASYSTGSAFRMNGKFVERAESAPSW